MTEVYTVNSNQEAILELYAIRHCFKPISVQYQALSIGIESIKMVDEAYRKEFKERENMPSVTQKSGKWHIAHGFWCSCGYIRIMDSRMNEWKYCPVCGGAKMVEPQESEDKNE